MPIFLSLLKLIRLLAAQYQCGIFVILIRDEFYFRNMSRLHDSVQHKYENINNRGLPKFPPKSKQTNWADLCNLDFDTNQKLWNAVLVNVDALDLNYLVTVKNVQKYYTQ